MSVAWVDAYKAHYRHPSFLRDDNPLRLILGFECSCSGEAQTWYTSLREMQLAGRPAFDRFNSLRTHGQGQRRRKAAIAAESATRRSRALLHSMLTREQRWELKGTGSFTVRGGDGKSYSIGCKGAHNVLLLEDGKPVQTLCVVSTEAIPVYDTMLVQKLMLESSPESFLKIANKAPYAPPRNFLANLLRRAPAGVPREQDRAAEPAVAHVA